MFAIDLTQIEGDDAFSCPQSENATSPNNETEETYSILEPKVNRHDWIQTDNTLQQMRTPHTHHGLSSPAEARGCPWKTALRVEFKRLLFQSKEDETRQAEKGHDEESLGIGEASKKVSKNE